jgi:hypothetical protein
VSALSLVLVGWLAAVTASAQAPEAGRIQIAGTRVSLVPPPGFTTSTKFPGIVHEPSGSAIAVTEAATSFAASAVGLSAERLAASGRTVLERREIALDGRKGHLLRLRQRSQVATMTRWIAITGDETTTLFITASCPESAPPSIATALERSLLSARWQPTSDRTPLDGLGFTVQERAPLRLAGQVGGSVMLTASGAISGNPAGAPFMLIGPNPLTVLIEPGGERRLAERWLTLIEQIRDPVVQSGEYVTVAGLTGYQLLAHAHEKRVYRPVVVYQLLLFHERTIYRVLGFTRPAEQQGNIEVFKSVAASFRLAPK